ncbi:MAG TPA: ABC transporter permease [Bryobacteraceae bacterium]|nr:ABC transporter permease [Bryobacteraceae bacterium]
MTFSDLRYAVRELLRRPGPVLTAVISLALGIGATTAVFSVIYAVLIDPFPYPNADRLVEVHTIDKSGRERGRGFSGAQIFELRQAKVIEDVVAEADWNLTTTDSALPEDVVADYVSADAATHFGVPAMLGRWFVKSDAPDGQEPQRVVVLTFPFWQRYYGGDPSVVGKTIQLVHKGYQIIGVMPPRFLWRDADIYLPQKLTADPNIHFGALVKLRAGVSLSHANAELQPYLDRFAKQSGNYPDQFRVNLRSITDLYAKERAGVTLYLLLGAVGLLLAIGCANVSILLLARGAQRRHEIAVRAALGAGRGDIVLQLLTESLLVALTGAALGVAIAWRGLTLIASFFPQGSIPAESVIRMNVPVLLFSVGLACLTAFAFGLSPALQLSRPDIAALMQSSLRRIAGAAYGKRTHAILIASQVTLTVLLLSSAAAATRGFLRMLNADLGYDPHNAMSVPIPVHEAAHRSWADRAHYFEQLRAKIAALPQVEAAGISTNATPPSNGNSTRAEILGSTSRDAPEVRLNFVSPEYFTVLRIPLVSGRMFEPAETMRGLPLALINETMARRYWPNGNAVGQAVRFPNMKDAPPYSPAAPGSDGWIRIVGIVADARDDGLRNPILPGVYVPYAIRMQMNTQILVRARVNPLTLLKAVRTALIEVDPEQQAMKIRDLNQWIEGQGEYARQRLIAWLMGGVSILALVLAAVGLYSVVSYSVTMRTGEFGVRMALGARRRDVIRIVFASVSRYVAGGLLAGLLLSIVFDRVAAQWISETARDPLALLGVAGVLTCAASLACFIPARRAASVDPMAAVRYE